jgi:hypothetical protein
VNNFLVTVVIRLFLIKVTILIKVFLPQIHRF